MKLTHPVSTFHVSRLIATVMQIPLKQYFRSTGNLPAPAAGAGRAAGRVAAEQHRAAIDQPAVDPHFIDTAATGGGLDALITAAGLFIAAALANQALLVGATYLGENIGWTATNALRADLAEHCLRLDLSFHKARTPGELIERIDGDVNTLSNFFSQFVIHMLEQRDPVAGGAGAPVPRRLAGGAGHDDLCRRGGGVLGRIRQIAVPYYTAWREASAGFYGFLGEVLAATEDVRANGAGAYVLRRFHACCRTGCRSPGKRRWSGRPCG